MTDLQITLFGAGGVFIIGVFSYNKWQEYKAKKSVDRAFGNDHDDVLMGPAPVPRNEPSFQTDAAALVPSAISDSEEAAPAAPVADTQSTSAATELATSMVDPLIDCLLPMTLEAPVRGDKILPVLQTLRLVGSKPVHFIGLHVNGDWESITHGGVYTQLQGGIQLANRSSPLNELEYSELVTRLRVVADEIGAEPEIADMGEVMAEARTLHRFVAGHDAQLGINVHTNGAPWALSTLQVALEKQGFDARPDGRFVMPDGDGSFLFSLSTNATLGDTSTPRLTLLLDVPCVSPARDGFGAMNACARSLVARLDGSIVDDSNVALSDEALAEIAGQVHEFYQEMEASDIPAGSTRALRLFS